MLKIGRLEHWYIENQFKLVLGKCPEDENVKQKYSNCTQFFIENVYLDFLIIFFTDDDECVECEAILEELETVDDEADAYGIDFVKNNDPHAARQYNIYNTPALVYFRRMNPVV